jgi:hypothetical protein
MVLELAEDDSASDPSSRHSSTSRENVGSRNRQPASASTATSAPSNYRKKNSSAYFYSDSDNDNSFEGIEEDLEDEAEEHNRRSSHFSAVKWSGWALPNSKSQSESGQQRARAAGLHAPARTWWIRSGEKKDFGVCWSEPWWEYWKLWICRALILFLNEFVVTWIWLALSKSSHSKQALCSWQNVRQKTFMVRFFLGVNWGPELAMSIRICKICRIFFFFLYSYEQIFGLITRKVVEQWPTDVQFSIIVHHLMILS